MQQLDRDIANQCSQEKHPKKKVAIDTSNNENHDLLVSVGIRNPIREEVDTSVFIKSEDEKKLVKRLKKQCEFKDSVYLNTAPATNRAFSKKKLVLTLKNKTGSNRFHTKRSYLVFKDEIIDIIMLVSKSSKARDKLFIQSATYDGKEIKITNANS